MLEDHIVRVLLATMGKQSKMIIRYAFRDGDDTFTCTFQYQNLRGDLAMALYKVFQDFQTQPHLLGLVPVSPDQRPAFAALKGVPYVLVEDASAPAIRGLRQVKGRFSWGQAPLAHAMTALPGGRSGIQYSLRSVHREDTMTRLGVDQQVMLALASAG